MIDVQYCVAMSRYNRWMNEKVYAVCEALPDADRKRDLGAFFGSIHATLDHLLYADLAWLSRFTGDPKEVPSLGGELHEDFGALADARRALDARLLAWAGSLTKAWLADPFRYTSKVDGRTRETFHWVVVTHLFNHQTHHRGQVTTLLSQQALDVGSTDLTFMPGITTEPG